MTEAEALQRYDRFLWKQVHEFTRRADKKAKHSYDDLHQEARIAFLQFIRTHDETMWTACTLTIRRALYDYVRQEYQLKVSYNGFSKVLKEKWKFYPVEEYLTTLGECHEDDHTDIDLREAIDRLSDSDRQIILMKLEGMTQKEIADRTGRPPQTISFRIREIRRKIIA